jgi:eukaryotic-like serine/threonine-protein kinase
MSAQVQLLRGLVALKEGLVSLDQLAAATAELAEDLDTRDLLDFLRARGLLTAPQRDGLHRAAARHLERHGGDVDRALTALLDSEARRRLLAAAPHLTTRLPLDTPPAPLPPTGPYLPAGGSAQTLRLAEPGPQAPAPPPAAPAGRFRVLREHARGGLGQVSVALDQELGRAVALKEIRPDYADHPESHRRFLTEARITGGLEHPGVVPIYALGHDGQSYDRKLWMKG